MFRCLLLLSFLVALPAFASPPALPRTAESQAQAVAPVFLSKVDARKAFTDGPARTYFNSLYPLEMQVKTRQTFTGMSLREAREKTRQYYASEVQEFTDGERAMLEGVVQRLRPALEERAPLYARTPWSFIKVSMEIEGGLPHTRGDHIVLSPLVLQSMEKLHAEGKLKELDSRAANLLVHELTHVLQRRRPDIFNSLATDVFGFRRLSNAPSARWLVERGVVNPDAPDCGWAFPLKDGTDTRWIMPYLVLRESESPRMPRDFMMVGITVEQQGNRWVVANGIDKPNADELANLKEYADAFPDKGGIYHPNEIAADFLAAWITGTGNADMNHPVVPKGIAWAESHLK